MKQRKIKLVCIGIVLLLIALDALFLFGVPNQTPDYLAPSFLLDDYQQSIEQFSVDAQVGLITDIHTAAEAATGLWNSLLSPQEITATQDAPIQVYYNQDADYWLVKGTPNTGTAETVPCAIIASSGDVIAVWMG